MNQKRRIGSKTDIRNVFQSSTAWDGEALNLLGGFRRTHWIVRCHKTCHLIFQNLVVQSRMSWDDSMSMMYQQTVEPMSQLQDSAWDKEAFDRLKKRLGIGFALRSLPNLHLCHARCHVVKAGDVTRPSRWPGSHVFTALPPAVPTRSIKPEWANPHIQIFIFSSFIHIIYLYTPIVLAERNANIARGSTGFCQRWTEFRIPRRALRQFPTSIINGARTVTVPHMRWQGKVLHHGYRSTQLQPSLEVHSGWQVFILLGGMITFSNC